MVLDIFHTGEGVDFLCAVTFSQSTSIVGGVKMSLIGGGVTKFNPIL